MGYNCDQIWVALVLTMVGGLATAAGEQQRRDGWSKAAFLTIARKRHVYDLFLFANLRTPCTDVGESQSQASGGGALNIAWC
jgi:hypothetical protein